MLGGRSGERTMGVFDQTRGSGVPYHLRPSRPEEIERHRRMLTKAEAMKRAALERPRVADGPASGADGQEVRA